VITRALEARLPWLPDPALTLLTLGCTAAGIAAFLLDVAGVLRMPWTMSFVSLPALVVVLALAVWAQRVDRQPFLERLVVGATAGLIATLAYDGVRWVIQETAPLDYDGFRAINIFGSLILDRPATDPEARVAGWVYHFWNGVSFGVMYALVAGNARWYWGLGWGMALEMAMIGVYPFAFSIQRSDPAFLAISLTGHAAYGATLGGLCQRWCSPQRGSERRAAA
jgi:hypothetical protein